MAILQRRDDGRQGTLEGGEEDLLAAIAEAHPKNEPEAPGRLAR